jgi:hypothetical protein
MLSYYIVAYGICDRGAAGGFFQDLSVTGVVVWVYEVVGGYFIALCASAVGRFIGVFLRANACCVIRVLDNADG